MSKKRTRIGRLLILVFLAGILVSAQSGDCNFVSLFSEVGDDPDFQFAIFAPSSYDHDSFLWAYPTGCCDEFGGIFWPNSDLLDDVNMRWDIYALAHFTYNPEQNLVHEVRCHDPYQYDPCGVSGTNWPTPDHYEIDGILEVIRQGYEEVEVGILDPENLTENFPYWVTTTWDKTTELPGSAEFYSESELTGDSPFSSSVWYPVAWDVLGYTRNSWQEGDCLFGEWGC